ncbi:MAG: hypothetical protein O2779_01335 [Nanoarchaeota archaeon]|nr:hypothetical protein [Nanoarchaeota archaeon]
MDIVQRRLDRIAKKQDALWKQKKLDALDNQHHFDVYLGALDVGMDCRFMKEVSGVVDLCGNALSCKYKGELYASFSSEPKPECKRSQLIKFEDILG